MPDRIVLETDEAVVEIVPRLGGSLAAFDLKKGGERIPILRRWTGESENPRALASSPMVPWFNRISGGGFNFGGKFYPIEPNDPLEPVPLHGDGWISPWEVAETKARPRRAQASKPRDPALRLRGDADHLARRGDARHGACAPASRHGAAPLWPRPSPLVRAHARRDASKRRRPACGWSSRQPFPPKTEPAPIPEKWDFNTSRATPRRLHRQRLCRLGRPRPHRLDGPRRSARHRGRFRHALLSRLFARQGLPDLLLRAGDASEQRLGQAGNAGGERAARARAGRGDLDARALRRETA